MNCLAGKRLGWLFLTWLCGCAAVNPPSDMRIYSAGKHKCVCQDMPADFHVDEAWVVGGGLWLSHVEILEQCKQVMELK